MENKKHHIILHGNIKKIYNYLEFKNILCIFAMYLSYILDAYIVFRDLFKILRKHTASY